ncbi:CoA transferase [Streptomyces sp. CA-100214]
MSALQGVQVIEFGSGVALSVAGMHLADHGADVVKLEHPKGDPLRSTRGFPMFNRGKRSAMLADKPSTAGTLRSLLLGADVLLLSSPTHLAAYGLDATELTRLNPRLIVTLTSVYGLDAAPWAHDYESNGLLSASLGISWRQMSYDGGPVEPVSPVLLYVHGAWAATCVIAALVSRQETGFGQELVVSAVDAVAVLNIGAISMREGAKEPQTHFGPGGRHPSYTRFKCADGVWITSGALGERMERAFLKATRLEDILGDPRVANVVDNLIEEANLPWIHKRIQSRFLEHDSAHWLAALDKAGIPTGVLAQPGEWLDDEQVRAIGMRLEISEGPDAPLVMPGVPVTLYGTPADGVRPAPFLGSTDLADAIRPPLTPAPTSRRPLRPGPLAGHQVLSIGTFLALPYSGGLLAELGADVVRVEPAGGDPFRARGFHFTRGTRSCALDLKSRQGQDALHALAAKSGVVMNGLRPGTAPRMRLDHDSLAAIRADVVTVTLSAYGDVGPKSGLGGVDMVVQGECGLMHRQGGADEPVITSIAVVDITTAVLLAMAATLGIYVRATQGIGQRTSCALAATAAYIQCSDLVESARDASAAGYGGEDFRGPDADHRFYATTDGWVRIEALPDTPLTPALLAAAGVQVDPERFAHDRVGAIAVAVGTMEGHRLVAGLTAVGVPTVRARRITEAIRDPRLVADEFVHVLDADNGGYNLLPGRLARFSATPRVGPRPTPGAGEHTEQALTAAGYSPGRIRALLAAGAAVQGGRMPQVMPVVSYR